LLDYIYSSARISHETGIPMMRPLPFSFPDDETVADCNDEYLFGPDMLVAPMHSAGNTREILLPVGRWMDFWTGEFINGPVSFNLYSPIDRIPLYIRVGAKIPVHLNSNLKWGESMTNNRVMVMVVTKPETGKFIVEVDNPGISYMLIFGVDVSSIVVNNREVPLLSDEDTKACPPGWFVDGTRVIVRLPAGKNRIVEIFSKEEKDE
jgi:alpha-glucosidase (family GH31 glycosyl hydrolase)